MERACRRPAVHQLKNRRFDLEVALAVQRLPDGTDDRGPGAHHVAGLRTGDQVGVALPHPGLFTQILVQGGQRTERLRRHAPLGRQYRQLTALAADHPTLHEHEVAQVDVGLPVGQPLLAHLGEREHHLQPGTGILAGEPVLQGGETQLAGVANEHHPAADADHVLGLLTGGEVPPLGVHLGGRVGASDADRVRIGARLEQSGTLVAPHLQLLGQGRFIARRGHRPIVSAALQHSCHGPGPVA